VQRFQNNDTLSPSMGILRGREELLPVTCAILKDSDREAFFVQLRKNRAGSPEELAKWLAVPVTLINDWMSGKIHIPYHTLQSISYQYSLDMPPVSELRRESLPAAQLPSAKPAEPPPPAREPRRERRIQEKRPPKARRENLPKKVQMTKPSDALAYWAAVYSVAVRTEGELMTLSADRRVGQNFAGVWASKTKGLFGLTCRLTMKDGGRIQDASCVVPDLNAVLARLGLGVGAAGKESLPRWIWSNPTWKSAYLKGLVDATASFQRKPALALEISPEVRHSVEKLLSSLGFKPHQEKSGLIAVTGWEDVARYFKEIGTENMKLRDQWNSFYHAESGSKPAGEKLASPPKTPSTPAASTTERKSSRPRRTLFRGRPGR
jgi:hypothetical protein